MAWLDRLQLEVVHADIFSMPVEAIAVNSETDLRLSHSLGRALLERYGEHLRADIDQIRSGLAGGKLTLGQAFTTPAYGLGTIRNIIFVAWWDRDVVGQGQSVLAPLDRKGVHECAATGL